MTLILPRKPTRVPPPAAFSRPSPAYDYRNVLVPSGRPRFARLSGRDGVLVEEGTQNKLVNPLLVDSNADGLPDSWAQDFTTGLSCVGGVQTFTATQLSGCIRQAVDLGAGNVSGPWMLSIEADAPDPNCKLVAYYYDVNNTYINGAAVPLSPGFARATLLINRTDVRQVRFRVEDQRASGWTPIRFRRPMLEVKPYATSFIDTTRAAEPLEFPANLLGPAQGTIDIEVFVNALARRQVAGQYNKVFYAERAASLVSMQIQHLPDSANWNVLTRDDASLQTSVNFADSNTPDGRALFTLAYSAAEIQAFINGNPVVTVASPKLASTLTRFVLGSQNGTGNFLNAYFGVVRFSSVKRSAAEVAAYAAGTPPADANTTLIWRPGRTRKVLL